MKRGIHETEAATQVHMAIEQAGFIVDDMFWEDPQYDDEEENEEEVKGDYLDKLGYK